MTKKLRKLYIIYCVSLVVDVLGAILCLGALLFGAPSSLEWIVMLVIIVIEIPRNIRSLRNICDSGANITDTVDQTDKNQLMSENIDNDSKT